MANPYRDEHGQYCSAGEMQAAVDRLKTDGDFDKAYNLERELHALQAAPFDLNRLFDSGISKRDATRLVNQVDGTGVDALYGNPALPEHVRKVIVHEAVGGAWLETDFENLP